MQAEEATHGGVALKERVRSGEANIHISEAEIASVHESAEACLSDMSATDAAYLAPQAYASGIANKIVRNGTVYDFSLHELKREGEERIERLKEEIGSEPIVGIENRVAFRFAKRAFDIVFSAAVLVCFSWLFALIAILIKIDDPKGPVFFKQTRVGKNGKTFQMLKFRSMCVDAEAKLAELKELNEKTGPVFKIADDPRITRVGKWLRKISLDELPQFVNVFRSDIPLRILKTRPEFSEESMGAFALPAKSSTNKGKVFSQVVSCFASGLRMHRISGFNCKRVGSMGGQFLAKPVFKAVCA